MSENDKRKKEKTKEFLAKARSSQSVASLFHELSRFDRAQ
jgi:hypothetical protein